MSVHAVTRIHDALYSGRGRLIDGGGDRAGKVCAPLGTGEVEKVCAQYTVVVSVHVSHSVFGAHILNITENRKQRV